AMRSYSVLSFFFQAEDGIRDYKVTGVQTCALPIFPKTATNQPRKWRRRCFRRRSPWIPLRNREANRSNASSRFRFEFSVRTMTRSEERRVGKECRYRGWPDE